MLDCFDEGHKLELIHQVAVLIIVIHAWIMMLQKRLVRHDAFPPLNSDLMLPWDQERIANLNFYFRECAKGTRYYTRQKSDLQECQDLANKHLVSTPHDYPKPYSPDTLWTPSSTHLPLPTHLRIQNAKWSRMHPIYCSDVWISSWFSKALAFLYFQREQPMSISKVSNFPFLWIPICVPFSDPPWLKLIAVLRNKCK
jgi:hypothetical protein